MNLGDTISHQNRPRRLAWPRTSPFHGGNTGSNPVGDASKMKDWLDPIFRADAHLSQPSCPSPTASLLLFCIGLSCPEHCPSLGEGICLPCPAFIENRQPRQNDV